MADVSESLTDLRDRWDEAGRTDPFWAVLSDPDKTGNRWAPDDFFQKGVDEIDSVVKHLRSHGVVIEGDRALDFGCGPGRLSQALATYFQEVDGVDISPSMIELAVKLNRQGERCRYHLNVAGDLAIFGDSTFNFIYSNITLQHVGPKNARGYIKEFVRVLKPGGVMMFQLPGRRIGMKARVKAMIPASMLATYRRARYQGHPAAEMHGQPREEVIAFVRGLGAELLAVETNHDAGSGWESFRYTWRRSPSGAVA